MIAVVLVITLVLYFSISAQKGVWHAVPSQTALVLEFNSLNYVKRLTDKAEDSSWKSAFQAEIFNKCRQDMALLQSLFDEEPVIQNTMEKGRLLSAFLLNDADSLHGLFIMHPKERFDLEQALQRNTKTQKYFPATFHGHTLYTVWFSKEERMVICQIDNLVLFSRFSYLLEEAIVQTEQSSSWWANRKYVNELKPDAPFRLFIRPEALAPSLQRKTNPLLRQIPELFSQNVEWLGMAWDGIRVTMLAETKGFLSQLATWGTVPRSSVYAVVPDHTAILGWIGNADAQVLADALGDANSSDFKTYVSPWLGNGVALAITEPHSPGFGEDQLLFLSLKDSALAMQRLRAYGSKQGTLRQETYQTFDVFEFLSPSIIAPLVGEQQRFKNPACVILPGYVVFAASRSALEVCIDKYVVNQTLANTPDCIQLLNQLPAECNGTIILNAQYFNLLSQNFLSDISFENNKSDLQKILKTGFSGAVLTAEQPGKLSLQWAAQAPTDPVFQTGIIWKTPLAAAVQTAPFVIKTASGAFILVQDSDEQLYCLNEGGTILWRRQMEGPLLSSVQSIATSKGGDVQFAFNTANHLWLLDEKGQDVGRFPIELRSPATNGVLAVDFDKNLKFNYFIACKNGNLYGFDHTGSALPGWNPNSSAGQVVYPIRHFQQADKDFLIALNSAAQLKVFGRNGQSRFPPVSLSGQFACPPQVDENPKASRIVCFNTQGKVFVCNTEGAVFSLQLGASSPKSRGVFAPLLGDGRFDFALLQDKKLTVHGYEGAALRKAVNMQLPVAQDTIFEIEGHRIGLLNRAKRQIYLLDSNGKMHPDFPLAGTGPFEVQHLRSGSKESLLIVGNGNQLYAYTIQ